MVRTKKQPQHRVDTAQIVSRVIPIEAIEDHPDNYNMHPDTQIAQLAASHQALGQYRAIVVWERPGGRYIRVAGHGYSEAAKREGATELRCEVLPVDTPAETIKAIMVADNEHAKQSQPDEEVLAHLLQEQQDAGFPLAALGSDEETLRQMLDSLGDGYLAGDEGEEEEDESAEIDEEQTRVKLGDVWQLGRHKIACINSCDEHAVRTLFGADVATFVWSDPPYGISIVATNVSVGGGEAYDIPFGGVKNRKGDVGGTTSHIRKTGMTYMESNKAKGLGSVGGAKPFGSKAVRGTVGASNVVDVGKYAPVIGDETTETAIRSFSLAYSLFPQALHVWWGANYYASALPDSKCWIVWDKENTGNFADAELAWCSDDSVVRIFKHMWNGMLKDSEHGQKRIHPTQKPVKLAEWAFEKYGKEGDIIFDPFLGSGMSVIAAERTNRTVIGCELSPDYIDAIIARWERETGEQAVLLERVEEVTHA